MNTKRTLLTKTVHSGADAFYQNEFSLVVGTKMEEELQHLTACILSDNTGLK